MKLVLMQPYFFPYLGYFDLINRSDRWIVFDTAQYIQQGWINRNRVLHPNEGWRYIIAPVRKHSHTATIGEVMTDDTALWRKRLPRQLGHYRKAPFFAAVMRLVEEGLADPEPHIARLNVNLLERICRYLGIDFGYEFLSAMNLDLQDVRGPGDWGLQVSRALGASEYVNATGGGDLFDRVAFRDAGIKLTVVGPVTFTYDCNGFRFEPHLSIIDVLMWNAPAAVKSYLDSRLSG